MTGLFNKNPKRHLRKLVKEKKYDEALLYGHNIEKKLEHDPDIAFIIGTIYFIKGDAQKTLVYMDKSLEIGEYDIDALSIKASVYIHQKQKTNAKRCCEKIREIDPKSKTLQQIEDEITKL